MCVCGQKKIIVVLNKIEGNTSKQEKRSILSIPLEEDDVCVCGQKKIIMVPNKIEGKINAFGTIRG